MNQKRSALAKKSMLQMAVLTLILIVGTCFVTALRFHQRTMENYGDFAFSYTNLMADAIDGDAVVRYLETGEQDEYYFRIKSVMDDLAAYADLKYFYLVVPTDTGLIYIWDAEPDEVPLPFLTYEDYTKDEKENIARIMSGTGPEKLDFYPEDEVYVASAMTPVYDSAGNPVGIVGADIAMNDVQKQFYRMIGSIAALIAAIMLVMMTVYYHFVRTRMIEPLVTLETATNEIVDNLDSDETFKADIKTGDEIEDLAKSFEKMDVKLHEYIGEIEAITAERERIGAELDLAERIQRGMLPSTFPPFPDRTEFDIYASMDPAKEVGGDFYDFFMIDKDHLALAIADVSGKGIPAALFMMASKIMIKNYTTMFKRPATVLDLLNNQICANNPQEMFVTVWLGILDLRSGKLTAVNAGHEYPVIRHPGGEFEVHKDKHCFVVGGIEESEYKEYEMTLEPGSTLFLYTDGLPEAVDKDNNQFGVDRALEVLNGVSDMPAEDVLEAVAGAVTEFVGSAEQFDDLTMLCIEYKG